MTPPYAEAPGAIRVTLAHPQPLTTVLPATFRTLADIRQARIDRAAREFEQAVRDLRRGEIRL